MLAVRIPLLDKVWNEVSTGRGTGSPTSPLQMGFPILSSMRSIIGIGPGLSRIEKRGRVQLLSDKVATRSGSPTCFFNEIRCETRVSFRSWVDEVFLPVLNGILCECFASHSCSLGQWIHT